MKNYNSEGIVETVRQATDIVDIISQYVRLQKRGKNYLGLCPFHNEKTPSFTVNREKGLYHCFGCGVGGNVFTFVTQYEKVSFGEALRQLAARANIQLPSYSDGKQNEVDEILDINDAATSYYREMLRSNEGAGALDYLRTKRKFTDESIDRFMLGFAPDRWDGLLNYLRKKSINDKTAEKSGLVLRRQDGSGYYDRFRARIMFPVQSPSGRVIAFGGRALKADEKAKYINSPETASYIKGKTLFGIYQAKDSIIEKDSAILVEGYADLIALHQSGIRNAVASSGTALTIEQIQHIARYTRSVYLVYDADTAGQDATLRGSDILLEQGMNVFIVELPPGEDPDTFVLSRGDEEFMALIRDAMDIVEFKASLLLRRSSERPDPAAIINSIVDSLAKIDDRVKANILVKSLSEKFRLQELAVQTELVKRRRESTRSPSQAAGKESRQEPMHLSAHDRDLINLLINVDMQKFTVLANQLQRLHIQNSTSNEIITMIIEARMSGKDAASIYDRLSSENVRKIFAGLAFEASPRSRVWWEEIRPESETPDYLKWISQLLISFELEQLDEELRILTSRISDAEKKHLPTSDVDSQYQELVERKRVLSQTYGQKDLLEQYFENLKNT